MSKHELKSENPENKHLLTSNFEKFTSFNQNPSQSSIANDSKMDSTFKSQTQPSVFSHERHDSNFSNPESQNQHSVEHSNQQMSTSFKSNQFLEVVPERSIEHSATTNKPSFMDHEASRNRYDLSNNNSRIHKSGPISTEFLLEKYDGARNPYKNYTSNVSGPFFDGRSGDSSRTFHSPRFQIELNEPKRTKSRDAGPKDPPPLFRDSKEFARFQRSSDPEFAGKLQPGTKIMEDNLFSLSKNSYYGNSVGTSINFSDKKRDGLTSTKYASNQQALSEFDTEGNADKRMNWEFPNYSRTDVSTTKPSELDYGTYERTRLDTLESKLDKKEKQYMDMQTAYENAHQLYISTRDELIKVKVEREGLFSKYMEKKEEAEDIRVKMHQLQERDNRLQQQVKELKQSEKGMRDQFEDIENENHRLAREQNLLTKKYEAKIEALTYRLLGLENEKSAGVKEEKLARKRSFEEEQDKLILKSTITSLRAKNDELTKKIHYLKRISEENELEHNRKLDEALTETRKIIEEKAGDIEKKVLQEHSGKMKKYKEKIAALRAENNNLRVELDTRPSIRRFKENEAKIKALEQQLQEAQKGSHHHQLNFGRRNSDVGVSKRIFKDIFEELSIDNVNQITSRFREINYLHHENSKFLKKLANLVYQCSPPGQFKATPTLKDIWKWLKALMEEYMTIKRNYVVDTNREYIKLMMDFLGADKKDDLLMRMKHLVNEHASMARILKYVRFLHNLDPSLLLADIEKILEDEVNESNDPHEKLKYYKQSV